MDSHTLDSIYQQYMPDVYRYLFSLCRDHHTAEDLVQETFYRAYLHLDACRDDRVKPWLFRVAYHVFIDRLRKEKRNTVREADFFSRLPDRDTPENRLLLRERREELGERIARLPERQKQAVLLHDVSGLSYREAADIMEISLPLFKISLYRARQKLRLHSERMEPDE